MTEGTSPGLPASGSPEAQRNLHERPDNAPESIALFTFPVGVEDYIKRALEARDDEDEERRIHRLAKRILTSHEGSPEEAVTILEASMASCDSKTKEVEADKSLGDKERETALKGLEERQYVLQLTYAYFEKHNLINHNGKSKEEGEAGKTKEESTDIAEKVSQDHFLAAEIDTYFGAYRNQPEEIQSAKTALIEDLSVALMPNEMAPYAEHIQLEIEKLESDIKDKRKRIGALEIEIKPILERIDTLDEFIADDERFTKKQRDKFKILKEGRGEEPGEVELKRLGSIKSALEAEIKIDEEGIHNLSHLSDIISELIKFPVETNEKTKHGVDKRRQLFRASNEKVLVEDTENPLELGFLVISYEQALREDNHEKSDLRSRQIKHLLETLFPSDSRERVLYLESVEDTLKDLAIKMQRIEGNHPSSDKLRREKAKFEIIQRFLNGEEKGPEIAAAITEEAPPEDSIELVSENQEKAAERMTLEREKRIAASLRKLSSIMIRGEETGKLIDALKYAERLAKLELSEKTHRSLNDAQLDVWEKGYRQLEAIIKANFEAEECTSLLRAIQDRMTFHYERMKKYRQDAEEMPEPTNEEVDILQSRFKRAEKEYKENTALFELLSRIAENLGFPVPDFEF